MMLDAPETSILNQNLCFVKNEIDEQLNELFTEHQQQKSRAPFKLCRPYPGICIKAFKKGTKQKFFINVCHTNEIPAPKDISESELHKLIEEQNATDFKVPLSVTQPRIGKDKSGNDAEISDVAVNSDFFKKRIIHADGLFYHFLITLVFESLEQKYKIEIDTTNFVLLKNRACIDKLVEHQIYNRDIQTVMKYNEIQEAEVKNEILGEDDTDKIVMSTDTKSKKVLIEEIPQKPLPARKKSLPNINTTEPEHRLFIDQDELNNRQKLIAEFYMPDMRDFKEISVEANDDRLVVSSVKHGYAFDGFLPQKIDEKRTLTEFDSERMILKVMMVV